MFYPNDMIDMCYENGQVKDRGLWDKMSCIAKDARLPDLTHNFLREMPVLSQEYES